jgi:hypothetical protein
VLARDAPLGVVSVTLETLDTLPWLPFFPSARAIDRVRLPGRTGLVALAAAAGLALARHRIVQNPVAPDFRRYADRIALRAISTLRLLSDEEFARGTAEFRRWCERQDRGRPVDEALEVFEFRP